MTRACGPTRCRRCGCGEQSVEDEAVGGGEACAYDLWTLRCLDCGDTTDYLSVGGALLEIKGCQDSSVSP